MTVLGRVAGARVTAAAAKRIGIEPALGFALLRHRQIPVRSKFWCLAAGVAVVGVLAALELPLEAIVAAGIPLFGVPADLIVDGTEFLVLPIMIASLLLPRFAPRDAVQLIRERRHAR